MKNKIKVNYLNNLFWLAPSISTYFRGRQFGYMPFKTLEDLINKNGLSKFEILFSFNALGDKNFDFFNALNRLRDLKFRIGTSEVYKINKEGFVDDNTIHEHLIVRWDNNSLKSIRKGNIPFYSKEWFIEKFVSNKQDLSEDNKVIIKWYKKEFIDEKELKK